jgi:hypothetical protein
MKVKLNTKQIADIYRELKETDRKKFDLSEVTEVFRMLQYWSKSVAGGEAKIKSIAELPDGFLCRVNKTFHTTMKEYLRGSRHRRAEAQIEELAKRQAATEYDRLIKEAEEREDNRKMR